MNTLYIKKIFTTGPNSMETSPRRMKKICALFLAKISDAIR